MPRKSKYTKKSIDQKQSKQIRTLSKKVKQLEKPIERKWLDTAIDFDLNPDPPQGNNTSVQILNNVLVEDCDGTVQVNNEAMPHDRDWSQATGS